MGSPTPRIYRAQAGSVWSLTAVYISFFFSGFAALLYQVAWQRLLALFSGSDAVSVTIVVSAFLAGLGLGSGVGGLFADRLTPRRALLLFALLNAVICGFAIGSKTLYYDVVFLDLQAFAGHRSLLLAIAFLSLLVPTFAMGCSLPLVSRAVVADLSEAPSAISRLYAVDVIGAALGCLVTTWLLLGTVGLSGTTLIGAAVSAAAGLFAVAGALMLPSVSKNPEMRVTATDRLNPTLWKWAAFYFVSGFVAVGLEIIWVRVFFIKYWGMSYTFGHILAIYLVSNAAGLYIGSRFSGRMRNATAWFCILQFAGIGAAVVILAIETGILDVDLSAYANGKGIGLYRWYKEFNLMSHPRPSVGNIFVFLILWPVITIAPAAFLIGTSFQAVQRAVQSGLDSVGRAVGWVMLANVFGNSLGGIVTGLILFPTIGTVGSLVLFSCIALGFLTVAVSASWPALRLRGVLGAGVLVCGVLLLPSEKDFWPLLTGSAWPSYKEYVSEDADNVTVLADNTQGTGIFVSGFPQGGYPFSDTHISLGAIGPLMHPNPRHVLIIGFGSGGTPYGAGINPSTERVTVVEIAGGVYDVQRRWAEVAEDRAAPFLVMLKKKRYQLIHADGRKYLATRPEEYDVIEGDPLFPYSSRSGFLYSREYFELLRSRLASGGLAVQWAASPRVVETFRSVFPYGIYVSSTLIGSNAPVDFDRERLFAALRAPAVEAYMREAKFDIDGLRRFIEEKPHLIWGPSDNFKPEGRRMNTDLFPRDEFFLNN